LVQSALDGYNVCLFSYGQTGSGKTYTMQGGTGDNRGIIPRAIEQVGNYKQQLEKDGWKYEMKISFLEIYNETIRDLLRDDGSKLLKHEIKEDADGRRFVSDLTMVSLEPTNEGKVQAKMRQAAKHRAVGSTDMNSESSRSHSVLTLYLTASHPHQRQALRGMLNLVDLAGSGERLSRSNASDDALAKETAAINKALSALTNVFDAINKNASHIPFRNSKLTYLLQPCLSGNGKALMMVNLSPTVPSAQESLNTLRFAAKVNKCDLGEAKRFVEDVDDDDAATFIASETGSRVSVPKTPIVKSTSNIGSLSSNASKVLPPAGASQVLATKKKPITSRSNVGALSSVASNVRPPTMKKASILRPNTSLDNRK
jgi:kinesin family protein C1